MAILSQGILLLSGGGGDPGDCGDENWSRYLITPPPVSVMEGWEGGTDRKGQKKGL